MLKGHVFAKQIFGNQIFALFINTFLNGKNGISNNYLNSMQVSYSGSTVTINSGAVCIQGRFIEEDTSTPVSVGTDNSYCKLVVEIDLDKENTESELNQVAYKIIKSTSSYPNLTQQDIVNNNSGIYQYELARFKTTASGITDFQDTRTFLDFDSIYAQIEQHIKDIDDGALFIKKSDIQVIHSRIDSTENAKTLYYPNGLDYQHCAVISIVAGENDMILSTSTSKQSMPPGTTDLRVVLQPDSIVVERTKSTIKPNSSTFFRLVLLKISEEMYSEQ